MLISSLNASNPDPIPVDSDPTIAAFEEVIDQIVQSAQNSYEAIQQAAIQKAEKEEEIQKQITFLSGAVQQAEASLSGAEGASHAPPPSAPSQSASVNLDYNQQQVVFWKNKLIQAEIPDGDTSSE